MNLSEGTILQDVTRFSEIHVERFHKTGEIDQKPQIVCISVHLSVLSDCRDVTFLQTYEGSSECFMIPT